MVHNPKSSQKIMSWCVESAINLIFNAIGSIDAKIRQSELKNVFIEESSEYGYSSCRVNSTLYDLKRRNYLEYDQGDSVRLTNKAKIRIIDNIAKSSETDGKFRLVSFDIPETRKTDRNCFRRAIKRMGFRQIQKSLWVSDRNIGELVEMAAKEYKVSDFVAYFIADKSNIDAYIKKILKKQ